MFDTLQHALHLPQHYAPSVLLTKALWCVGAFIIGGIPFGYLIPKLFFNINILEHGSGNTGGTNVWRVCGKVAGAATYLLDFLKAFVPVSLYMAWYPESYYLHILLGLAIIIGHSKSVFLNWQGGKSAMSSLGAVVALCPQAGIVCALLALTLILTTRIVSVGSMITGSLVWLVFWYFQAPMPYVAYAIFLGLFILVRHKANIQRLLQGTENRF
ncbi:MAG: glycerol-3-phosphate 1-O-acyltransferase PlsY [Vampirovibrionales bacterium]